MLTFVFTSPHLVFSHHQTIMSSNILLVTLQKELKRNSRRRKSSPVTQVLSLPPTHLHDDSERSDDDDESSLGFEEHLSFSNGNEARKFKEAKTTGSSPSSSRVTEYDSEDDSDSDCMIPRIIPIPTVCVISVQVFHKPTCTTEPDN